MTSDLAPTALTPSAYLTHLRRESDRFATVLRDVAPGRAVPSCPDWDGTDLLWHLAGVHHFWHHVIAHRPDGPDDYVEPEQPGDPAAVAAAFAEWSPAFLDALAATDPSDPAWSWSGAEGHQRVAFTYRRQAHEAAIHRIDAELVAGVEVTPLPADLATDGVHEALAVMYGALPTWGAFTPEPLFVEFRIEDSATSVWTQLGTFSGTEPDGTEHRDLPDQHVVDAPGRPADVVVSGTADRLDGWLWHRYDAEGITIEGDSSVWQRAAQVLQQPID